MSRKRGTRSDEIAEKRDTVRNESAEKFSVLRSALSWTHYRLLLRIEDQQARLWYMNEAVARYSVLNESKQLFASKYKLYLPDENELKKELERERWLIEEQADRRSKSDVG